MIIKDHLIRSALIMFTALFLAGCLNPFDSGGGNEDPAATGTLTVSLSDGISAQTLLPDLDMNVASYKIDGTGPAGTSFSLSTDQTTVTVESLAFGEWSVAVSALNGEEVVIGAGSSIVQVNTGETSTASVTVRPIDGIGALDLSVDWNDGDIQTPSIDAGLTPATGAAVDLPFTIAGSSASYTSSTIATGYHTLSLQLLDNGIVTTGAVEVVRIVSEETTSGSYLFDQVNKPGGTIDVEITPEMAEPLTVTISGSQPTVELGQGLNLTASVAEPVSAVYVWYVNGASVATGENFSFAADEYGLGYYRIDVTAFSADGTRAGSADQTVAVVDTSATGFTWAEYEVFSTPQLFQSIDMSDDGARIVTAVYGGQIYLSSDGGATWQACPGAGSRDWYTVSMSSDGSKIAAIDNSGVIFVSKDFGITWAQVHSIGGTNSTIAISGDGSRIIAASPGTEIQVSTDDGVTWTTLASGLVEDWYSVRLSYSGQDVVIGSVNTGSVYLSNDGGSTFTRGDGAGTGNFVSVDISSDGQYIAAGNNYGGEVVVSFDSGQTWHTYLETANRIRSVGISDDGSTIAACGYRENLYTSTDAGGSWTVEAGIVAGPKDWQILAMSADGRSVAVNGEYLNTFIGVR